MSTSGTTPDPTFAERARTERSLDKGDKVNVAEAQRDMRIGLMGGFMGQLVSGLLWLASAAFATWGTQRSAITILVVAGFFIFPLTKLGLRLIGHRARVSPDNPLNGLGMQAAFVLPLSLLVVAAATLYRIGWFYPAFMIVLGAHYLPFVTLYGMRLFYVLAGVLVGAGVILALYVRMPFSAGAWFTAAVLILFAVLGRQRVSRELDPDAASPPSAD
jgi:hypothetical protein